MTTGGTPSVAVRKEMDPLGQEVGESDPFVSNPEANYLSMKDGENERLYEEGADPFDPKGGCALDGMTVQCSFVMQALNSGAARQAHTNTTVGDCRSPSLTVRLRGRASRCRLR